MTFHGSQPRSISVGLGRILLARQFHARLQFSHGLRPKGESVRREAFAARPQPPREAWIFGVRKRRWYRANNESLEIRMTEVQSAAGASTGFAWKNEVEAGTGAKQQFFDTRPVRLLASAAILQSAREQRSPHPAASPPAARLDGGIKEFTKACLRILQLPGSHNSPHKAYCYD